MAALELVARLLVVAGIFAAAMWLLRRYAVRSTRKPISGDSLTVLARVPVGRGSSVMLVQSGPQRFVVGVGATVMSLPPESGLAAAATSPAADEGTAHVGTPDSSPSVAASLSAGISQWLPRRRKAQVVDEVESMSFAALLDEADRLDGSSIDVDTLDDAGEDVIEAGQRAATDTPSSLEGQFEAVRTAAEFRAAFGAVEPEISEQERYVERTQTWTSSSRRQFHSRAAAPAEVAKKPARARRRNTPPTLAPTVTEAVDAAPLVTAATTLSTTERPGSREHSTLRPRRTQ